MLRPPLLQVHFTITPPRQGWVGGGALLSHLTAGETEEQDKYPLLPLSSQQGQETGHGGTCLHSQYCVGQGRRIGSSRISLANSRFEASLGCKRPCLKTDNQQEVQVQEGWEEEGRRPWEEPGVADIESAGLGHSALVGSCQARRQPGTAKSLNFSREADNLDF